MELRRITQKFQRVNKGFRRIVLVPRFMFGLVMASRVGSHFSHSQWFQSSKLSKMVDVHGVVSVCMEGIRDGKADCVAVYFRISDRGSSDAGADREPFEAFDDDGTAEEIAKRFRAWEPSHA
jgi:hypothetical protein